MDKDLLIQRYNIYIYERVTDLLNSGKNIDDFDYKSDLHKIFEYFSCIKLTQEYNTPFYEYNDIDPTFKEEKQMSRNDTGIDACNLIDTIVQCKLRQQSLTWKECSTFFGSLMYRDESGNFKSRWNELIITRNKESQLSDNLNEKLRFKHFIDKTYPRAEILSYCKDLVENPPYHFKNDIIIEKRDYQEECIKLINDMNNENLIICLPTGTGKNFIITHSLQSKVRYLIMVPRIILMEQIKDEIIKYHPKMKSKIQLIGDSNNEFKSDKDITICVFNSVGIIKDHVETFAKIFVDEAHHIIKPEIYQDPEEDNEDNEEDDDCQENENCDNKSFIKIIKEFSKLNNNIYLSATIDKHDAFKFYKKDIREMIDNGYLCDYTINIPIFAEDPTYYSVCKYLIKNYRNIIIYCNSQKDGKSINALLNSIQKGSSEYIDCNTSKKTRNNIVSNYKSGKLSFLVNVKILVEGFDAPITKGVCFMSLPSSSTTLIQIIGRSLRLHPEKKMANVILPFSVIDDEKSICNFMKVMAKNDSRIKKSYQTKTFGGYFDIDNIIEEDEINNDNNEELMKDVEFKCELIFDSIGSLKNNASIWMNKLKELKEYIDDNKKRPSQVDKDKEIKTLGYWISNQQTNYKNKINIMSSEEIYNKWSDFTTDDKYKEYFLDNDIIWYNTLEQVKKYIDDNNKRPSEDNKNKEIKTLGKWISHQKNNYKNKSKIMNTEEIYNKWTDFINDDKYKEYFLDNDIIWSNTLENVKKYIDENKKRPSQVDKDKEIQTLGCWICHQKKNYKTKSYIMSSEEIYNQWTNFINDDKYKEYFLDNDIIWYNTLEQVKKYINDNKKKPSHHDEDKEIKKIGYWIDVQKRNYKTKSYIMSSEDIYNKWTDFINDDKYIEYFLDNGIIWYNTLEKVKKYINDNKKRPPGCGKDKEIKTLGQWLSHQKKNYKTKNRITHDSSIYNQWTNFINDDKYKEYFQ